MSALIFRLVVPNKGYSSLDQSPDEKPLVALDTDRYVYHVVHVLTHLEEQTFQADLKGSNGRYLLTLLFLSGLTLLLDCVSIHRAT